MNQIAIDREAMLGGASLAEWRKRDFARAAALVLLDLALIVAAAVLCELLWSPLLYVVVVMFIGGRQIGIGSIVLHDGAHGLLSSNRRRNDLFCRTLCLMLFIPLIFGFTEYRKLHLVHHRYTNRDGDPDLVLVENFYQKWSPFRVVVFMLTQLSGLGFLSLVLEMMRSGTRRGRIVTVVIIAGCVTGWLLSIRPVEWFLLYWVVPFATWAQLANQLRSIAEHYPAATFAREHIPAQALTRDVLPSWFDSLFVSTRGVNYHLTHHLFPGVPFFRLKALQRQISGTAAYQNIAHVTPGYHRVMAEVLRRRIR
jgi:fatty acid desaturase